MNELRKKLSKQAFAVTQEGDTEPPYSGEYNTTNDPGMYHCVVCGAPLFSSETKFDSRTGWPSFYEAHDGEAVSHVSDTSGGMNRTAVSCASCGAHVGHVFDDAPQTPTGQRYCINSCALSLEKE